MRRGRPRKLSYADALAIREWYESWSKIPKPKDVRKRYGISGASMVQIIRWQTYKVPA